MIEIKCVGKLRDKNNIIIKYSIQDTLGKQMSVTPEQLKTAIINKQVNCVNLTLTTDGRLIDKVVNNSINKSNLKAPSYFGLTIKNLNKFIGREGEAYQGDVYLHGKKLGFWSEDGNGAISDRFNFDKYLLLDSLHKHQVFVNQPYASTEGFMLAVVGHMEDYKNYKQMLKKGAKSLVVITDFYGMYVTYLGAFCDNEDEVRNLYSKEINNYIVKYSEPGKPARVRIYTCEQDFIIE